ncbi:MAG TPA: DUF302 domain-containing protein [Candidatus Polarisedimenticolaceae bacterium]
MSAAAGPQVGFGREVAWGFDEAIARAEQALKAEGFGVLTRIDVKATLKEKLGIDREPMVILGACNPPFAHRALEAEPQVGLLMPCNVVVREQAGKVVVEAMNPELMATMFPDRPLAPIAAEITDRLKRAIAAV